MTPLRKRGITAAAVVALVVGGVAGVARSASVDRPQRTAPLVGVHDAHVSEMAAVARANGLVRAPGGGRCGTWYQFRTSTGLHCAKAPMLADMLGPVADGPTADGPVALADTKVTCIGTGTDGKRMQLVYARRRGKADQYAATAPQMRGWAKAIDQTMIASAQKTGGIRRVRWAHDTGCVPTVLNIVVPDTVTTFSQLVDGLEGAGLGAADRKYLVAWDDGDATGAFCGLGTSYPDSTAGPTNPNETQPLGAMYAVAENRCWTINLVAHEMMHTLGAVQSDAPHATPSGHCTDESDLLCYSDAPGVVTSQVCDASQEALYDCKGDDYFNTNPQTGNYLKTHWNPADSGWLDRSGPADPPGYLPFSSWGELITRQHTDLVNRPPGAVELSNWAISLTTATKTPGNLDDELRRSGENLTNVDPVVRVYRAFLGRAPDVGGLKFWIKRKRNLAPATTWTVTQIAESFTASNEFKVKYGSLTNRQFVTRIYTDVLGRTADASGVDYWTRKLDTKSKTRAQVMVGFSESNEYKTKQAQNTDLAVAYAYLLGRAPTSAETTSWVTREKAGTSHAALLDELLDSPGYATRITG